MNAINFIKQNGVEKAREVVDGQKDTVAPNLFKYFSPSLNYYHMLNIESNVRISELKRLVESVELVKEHYTLDRAIEYANSQYTAPEIKVCLLDAIADYKSIYGVEHV